jgi:hypothetical protein
VRRVLKILPVTRGSFGILVDRHNDRLDMLVAPSFPYSDVPALRQCIKEGRVIFSVVVEIRYQ